MHVIRSLPWLVTRAVYMLSQQVFSEVHMKRKLVTLSYKLWARSIQPKFAEISVQNSMDRFGPTGKVSKKTGPLFEVDHFSRLDRSEFWARSIQPKFQPVRPGKGVYLKRWTRFFATFPLGPNRSIEFWTGLNPLAY